MEWWSVNKCSCILEHIAQHKLVTADRRKGSEKRREKEERTRNSLLVVVVVCETMSEVNVVSEKGTTRRKESL